ncbi:MAG: hypothetical protein ABJD13_17710 [Paracoccaceae bacterium]
MKRIVATAAFIAAGSIAAADTNETPEDVLTKTSCDVLLWPKKWDALPQADQFAIWGFLLGFGAQTTWSDKRISNADYAIEYVSNICGQYNDLTVWEATRIAIMNRRLGAASK